jgi:hypothetical protein
MTELKGFYDAMLPRIEEALSYLDRVPLDEVNGADRTLLDLCLSLADVALAVEKYGSPFLPDAPYSTGFSVDTSALG